MNYYSIYKSIMLLVAVKIEILNVIEFINNTFILFKYVNFKKGVGIIKSIVFIILIPFFKINIFNLLIYISNMTKMSGVMYSYVTKL